MAHVEAGLRSRDISMPEEINRLCTDVLCEYLFTTDHFANENLRQEGIAEERIHFVGNVMIDSLMRHRAAAKNLDLMQRLGLAEGRFATLTLHRPSNVDDPRLSARNPGGRSSDLDRASYRFPNPSAHAQDG